MRTPRRAGIIYACSEDRQLETCANHTVRALRIIEGYRLPIIVCSGTGFFINSDGWAVTNAHVLEGCSSATVLGIGAAVDWPVDRENDLALVRVVNGEGKAYVALRGRAPRLGEEIAAFGFPLRGILSESK